MHVNEVRFDMVGYTFRTITGGQKCRSDSFKGLKSNKEMYIIYDFKYNIHNITLFCFGLTGLCGLESLEWLCLLRGDEAFKLVFAAPAFAAKFRRLVIGVLSTDLKYFSCIESSLPPPPFPPSDGLRAAATDAEAEDALGGVGWYCWVRGEDRKLPERVSDRTLQSVWKRMS